MMPFVRLTAKKMIAPRMANTVPANPKMPEATVRRNAEKWMSRISPLGLPMLAAWLIGKLQQLRYAIQDGVY